MVVTSHDKQGNLIDRGSGFIVREDGAIATNYHLISNAKDIKIKADDKVFNVEGLIYRQGE